jgi:hypothetical protein
MSREVKNQKLGDVLLTLAKKELQVKLLTGFEDTVNGYGWHIIFYVQVFKTVEYCSKCRELFNVDYKDASLLLQHQHSHRNETVSILSEEFMDEGALCLALLKLTE